MRYSKFALIAVGVAALIGLIYVLSRPEPVTIRQAGTATKTIPEIAVQSRTLSDQINSLSFSPECDALFVQTKNQESKFHLVLRCSFQNIDSIQTLRETKSVLQGLVISADGNRVYTTQWHTGPKRELEVLQFDGRTGPILKKCLGSVSGIGFQLVSDPTAIGLSPDGTTVVVGTKLVDAEYDLGGHIGGEVCVWNTKSGELLWRNNTVHTNIVRSIAFSPDGKTVAGAGEDSLLRLWDVASGDLRSTLVDVLWGGVNSMQFSHEGKYLATGGAGAEEGGIVRVWDLSTGKIARRFVPFKRESNVYLVFDFSGRIVAASQSSESTKEPPTFEVHLWDTQNVEHRAIGNGRGYVRALTAAPNTPIIAAGTNSGELIVYELRDIAEP